MPMLSDTKKLLQSIRNLILDAQQHSIRNINAAMVLTYFEIGSKIVQQEQQGNYRAAYAKKTIERLSKSLTKEFGKGYSLSNLEYFRKFFITYQNRIPQSVIGELGSSPKRKVTSSTPPFNKKIPQTAIGELPLPFSLSWTHYIQLMKISNEDERNFYEIEAIQNSWSVRELQRQFDTAVYERLALARNKKSIKNLSLKGQKIQRATDALKSHYYSNFLACKKKHNTRKAILKQPSSINWSSLCSNLGKVFYSKGGKDVLLLMVIAFLLILCSIIVCYDVSCYSI
jgi:predicted nuclease of restriction endonuclease-like (RecB) superfamily